MYEIFEKLLKRRGITAYRFCKDTGVSTSTISTWKKKNSKIGMDLAETISNYFGVSIDYLMTGKEEDKKENSVIDIKDELERVRDLLKNRTRRPIYYDGEKLDDESLDAILAQYEMSLVFLAQKKK